MHLLGCLFFKYECDLNLVVGALEMCCHFSQRFEFCTQMEAVEKTLENNAVTVAATPRMLAKLFDTRWP